MLYTKTTVICFVTHCFPGSGDFVMAELQSKLKGRGRVEPVCSPIMKDKDAATPPPLPPKSSVADKLGREPSFQKELSSPQEVGREESIVPLERARQTAAGGRVRTMCLNLESSLSSSVTEESTSPSSAASCKPTIVNVSMLGEEEKSGSEDYSQDTEDSSGRKAHNGLSLSAQHRLKSSHAMRGSSPGVKARTPDGKPVDHVLVV